MKKLFTEPEIEILSFLCNDEIAGASDEGNLGGTGESGGDFPGILS